jgi:hypothetical protein
VVRVDSTATDRFDTGRFEASRNRLASLAYRLLGLPALAGLDLQPHVIGLLPEHLPLRAEFRWGSGRSLCGWRWPPGAGDAAEV